jgi:NAD(P)-dependent dehydrogenase (short-subunit alcohol dehydrogenase family)
MQLTGKVALVTGGGTGIGAATARRFAAEGARVVVTGRRAEPLIAVADAIGGLAVAGDAALPGDMAKVVQTCLDEFGGLDTVVANAGGEGGGAVADTDEQTWADSLESNLTSCFVTCGQALPALLARGGGTIVIVSSAAGIAAVPEGAGYTTAKTALLGLTRSLAVDYGPWGVRTNAVCPGWVRTPMADREMDGLAAARGGTREEAFALATARYPLRRAAEPDEIAACCLFLASQESSFVNGAVLVADGGAHAVDIGTLAFAGL